MTPESTATSVFAVSIALFVLSIGVGAALAFPEWGIGAVAAIRRVAGAVFGKCVKLNRRCRQKSDRLRGDGSTQVRHWLRLANKNRILLTITGMTIVAPAILAISLQRHADTGYFDDTPMPVDPVVLALLQGEQLKPPAPLPPEVFTTAEIEQTRPALGSANRDWNAIDSEFRQRLLIVFQTMRQRGYEVALLEGHRSPERQDYLASLGPHITRAGAFQSYHQYGLAADCAFYLGGRIIIDDHDPWAIQGYKLFGEAAEAAGLVWGGRWKMADLGHIELHRHGVRSRSR